jgi:hypothetical protein
MLPGASICLGSDFSNKTGILQLVWWLLTSNWREIFIFYSLVAVNLLSSGWWLRKKEKRMAAIGAAVL